MVGAYRCVRGHTWTPAEGSGAVTGTCPICGGAEESPTPTTADTPRPFVVAVAPGGPDPEPDPDEITSPHVVAATAEASEPTVASPVGMPTPPGEAGQSDLYAV